METSKDIRLQQAHPIANCSHPDFLQILTDIEDFWGSSRTLAYHHPMFIHEFGNTAFVIKDGEKVIAYLFGLVSQTEQTGYVHLVGVRESHQQKGLGRLLYSHFMAWLRANGIHRLKAITTPANQQSINFHLRLGMEMTGIENDNGIKVMRDYSGPGQDRVVFTTRFD